MEREKQCFSELLVIMSGVDGDFSMDEMLQVDAYLDEMGLKTLPSSIRSVNDIAAELLKSDISSRISIYFELTILCGIDNEIHRSESALLKTLATLLEIPPEKVIQVEEAVEMMPQSEDRISNLLFRSLNNIQCNGSVTQSS